MNINAACQLEEALNQRTRPLLIRLDENDCIVANHCDFESHYCIGVVFRHPEGPIDVGIDPPSNLEFYAQFIENFALLNTQQQREELVNQVLGEDPVPDANDEDFENWLSQQIDDDYIPQWAECADSTLGEGTPGFLILKHLTKGQANRLGIREVDLGGPASSCPMIQFSGDTNKLQEILESKQLQLRFSFCK